ncbi:hypothetical protein IX51_07030 [uncultured archaeon]|nr:hypothetical protein IX51_07030 [uncultured archaeon]HKJ96987.1 hypothetical protein [Thermoplasmataceae archaeon]
MPAPSKLRKRNDINSVISQIRKENELKDIPNVLVPLWQLKIRERFGINLDREIAEYVVLAAHERGTWKKQRAIRKIEKILVGRGETSESSSKIANEIVQLAVGQNTQ